MNKARIEYESNNSGGRWWLTDEDWTALEAAGWTVEWYASQSDILGSFLKGDRFLGALASSATRRGVNLQQAVEEWEQVTHGNSTDAGCPCCGQPHTFTAYDADDNYVKSGPHTTYSAEW